MFCYIVWNESSEIFSFGQFTLRWNGLLLILAFLIGRQVLVYTYKKEGLPKQPVDILTAYLIIGILLGARLGHVLFYQPQLWSKPLSIFFPFSFKPAFHFTGMTGFSTHGIVLGTLGAVWLYSRKKGAGHFLQVLDKLSILAPWMCIAVLAGSFLNSEIAGKPTDSSYGTMFLKPVTKGLSGLPCCIMRNPNGKNPLNQVSVKTEKGPNTGKEGYHYVILYLFFKPGIPQQTVDEFIIGDVKTYLYDMPEFISEPGTEPIHYDTFREISDDFVVRVKTIGIARYPVQLFEAASCLILFVFLFWYWYKHKSNLTPGRIFGFFMVSFWSLRLAYEFLYDEVSPVKWIGLNRGQLLSIPLIIAGIAILIFSYRNKVALVKPPGIRQG